MQWTALRHAAMAKGSRRMRHTWRALRYFAFPQTSFARLCHYESRARRKTGDAGCVAPSLGTLGAHLLRFAQRGG